MTTALGHRAWSDLSRRRARAVLTVLTLALAVASFGILAIPSLMNQAMSAQVNDTRLNNVAIPIDDVVLSPGQLTALGKLPNVSAVVARGLFATRAVVGSQRVDTEVWGVPNFSNQPVDRVITSTSPGPGEVLTDVQDATYGIYNGPSGARLAVQAANGSFQDLTVAGTGRGMAFNQDADTDELILYAPESTVNSLSGSSGVNYLELRLINPSTSAAKATVDEVRTFLAAQPHPTLFSSLPVIRPPGTWPLESTFDQRIKLLVILIILAVLSAAFLMANTIRTTIAEQTREIGIMRAVGASRKEVRNSYLRSLSILGSIGAVVGAVLGIGLAGLLVRVFGHLIFGFSPPFAIDWPVVVLSMVIGIAGTVLLALPMLRHALRTPVHDALETSGIGSQFGGSVLDRVAMHSRALPPPMRIGVRNVARQKGRSATTIVQIAIAVATLLGLLSLALAVNHVTNQSWNVLDYDITLSSQPGGQLFSPSIVSDARAQPGVSGVEAADWSQFSYRGQTLYALGVHAVPNTFVAEPLTAGTWFDAQDVAAVARVAIAGSAAARVWHLHPGSHLTVTTERGPTSFTIIGIGGSDANNGYNFYLPVKTLEVLSGHPGMVNSLLIRTIDKTHRSINGVATSLEKFLQGHGYAVRSQLMYAGRATQLASGHATLLIVEGLGLLIVAISMLGLVNAITMNIIERTREIGVLRSIGARASDLRRIFRTEMITLALIGFVVAVPLGWLLAKLLQWLVLRVISLQLPAPYPALSLLGALIGTVVLALLVIVLPLRRATHIPPGEAIRYD